MNDELKNHTIFLKSGQVLTICQSKRTAENLARCALTEGDYYIAETTKEDFNEMMQGDFDA